MKPRGFEFEEVLIQNPNLSWFDMSYKNKFTANWGKLYPFYLEESMPHDRFKIRSNCFCRLQPLLAPVMQQSDIFMYYFYVPNRLIWDSWKKFQSDGDGSVKMVDAASYVPPVHPYISLFDQLYSLQSFVKFRLGIVNRRSGTYYLTLINPSDNTLFTDLDYVIKVLGIFDFMGAPFNCEIESGTGAILLAYGPNVGDYTHLQMLNPLSSFAPPYGTVVQIRTQLDTDEIGRVISTDHEEKIRDSDKINALPFFAYNMIYNQYFRSQDYQDEMPDKAVDGFNEASSYPFSFLSKCFEHDYFTSVLPDCQRGPDVTLSLAGSARLVNDSSNFSAHPTQVRGAGTTSASALSKANGNNNVVDSTSAAVQLDITSHTKVDLSGVSAITINALRYANTLQRYEEQLARSGSRYNEMLLSLYGVESSDASIQRPIFLGASRVPITINDVAQTAEGAETPLATLAGRGVSVGDVFTDFYCEENGWVVGLLSIVPRTQYCQGLSRHLRKSVKLDYPVPLFANLGEEEILKEELLFTGSSDDQATLGYLPRFSSFKYHSDEVHSELKGSLSYWSMLRKVAPGANGVVIDSDFLKAENMGYDAFAVTSEDDDHFILDVTNQCHLLRALPEYSTPKL